MPRDPRVDPRPGDVVLENTFTKEVSRVYKDGKEMSPTDPGLDERVCRS